LCSAKAIKKKAPAGSSDPVIQTSPQEETGATLVTQDEPAFQNSPPPQDTASPARASSPAAQERENLIKDQPEQQPEAPAQEEVVVMSEQQTTAPEASTALAKVPAKPEPAPKDKRKTALEFSTFEDQDASSLHQSVLTRLSESRDTEIAMIISLKRKYEVICTLMNHIYM
jgi:hypothetical protein